jgi:hypothetical protein
MKRPSKDFLRSEGGFSSCAADLHPVQAFYKHHWRIFTLDSKWDGWEFLEKEPWLSTAACMQRLQELESKGEPYILYGGKRPRRFAAMPFDPESARWRNADWAPALEDDPDPEWNGHR